MKKPTQRTIDNVPQQPKAVGYCRPPQHTQFQPGQSGNPRGRPRGRRNFTTVVQDFAQGRIKVIEGGRAKTLPRFEALLLTMWTEAFKGNPKALAFVLQSLRDAGLFSEVPQSVEQPMTAEDEEVLRDYLRLHGVTVQSDQATEAAPIERKRRRRKPRGLQI